MNPKSNDTRPFQKVIQTRKTKQVLCFIEEKKKMSLKLMGRADTHFAPIMALLEILIH